VTVSEACKAVMGLQNSSSCFMAQPSVPASPTLPCDMRNTASIQACTCCSTSLTCSSSLLQPGSGTCAATSLCIASMDAFQRPAKSRSTGDASAGP
jgi:hypothetical protein